MSELKTIPLRERKKATTRLAILNAVIDLLEERRLGDITIDEICEEVQISKGTFFQYFPQKTSVLVLFGLLWNLEAMWRVTKAPGAQLGLEAIESMFEKLGQQVEEHPHLWAEIISVRALQPEAFSRMGAAGISQITKAERLINFPDLEGIESVKEGNFKQFFELNLEAAKEQGKLPADTDIAPVYLSLACIFYGVPLMSFEKDPMNCSENYLKQVRQLWRSLQ